MRGVDRRRRRPCRPTGPVAAAQHAPARSMPSLARAQAAPTRCAGLSATSDRRPRRRGSAGRFDAADLALGLGAHVPASARSTGVPARASSRPRSAVSPPTPHRPRRPGAWTRRRSRAVVRPSRRRPAGRRGRRSASLAPGGALLGQGARFVLGVAGLQGGLLGELDRLDRGRRPAVVAPGTRSASSPRRASMPARRVDQRCVQPGVDADDLADRALAAVGAGTFGEAGARVGSCRCCSRAVL